MFEMSLESLLQRADQDYSLKGRCKYFLGWVFYIENVYLMEIDFNRKGK